MTCERTSMAVGQEDEVQQQAEGLDSVRRLLCSNPCCRNQTPDAVSARYPPVLPSLSPFQARWLPGASGTLQALSCLREWVLRSLCPQSFSFGYPSPCSSLCTNLTCSIRPIRTPYLIEHLPPHLHPRGTLPHT